MSHSQFHCTGRVYLDLHGLIFETSICYWQDQPGSPHKRRHVCLSLDGTEWGSEGGQWPEGGRPPPAPLRTPAPSARVVSGRGAPAVPPAGRRTRPGRSSEAGRVWRHASVGGRSFDLRFSRNIVFAGEARRPELRPQHSAVSGSSGVGSSVGRPLGETGRLGLATGAVGNSVGEEEERLHHPITGALEANPQARGTLRPNTGARPAGGGPLMAGHGCQSISVED